MNLKLVLVIVWAIILGIHTWTDHLGALLRLQSIHFKWNPTPNFREFFYMNDITDIHHYFIIVKAGHFIGFAVFDFLVYHWIRSHKKALWISFFFALFTEILQLFFYRDGRLYDLIIDFCGAIGVYLFLKFRVRDKDNI